MDPRRVIADNSASGDDVQIEQNRKWSLNRFIFKNDGDKISLHLVYTLIFVLFATQLISFYYLYTYFLNLEGKYEVRFKTLQNRMNTYDTVVHRVKRDLGIKDNSIITPTIDEMRVDINDTEMAKNDSTLTIEEMILLKQNFSNEDWVWLNKYSRVPLRIMEEFCKTTREKCPTEKGEPGEKGDTGEKGEKGDQGRDGLDGQMGPKGMLGPRGPPGLRGEMGDKGEKGNAGVNARPAMPGNPGLDGIPGRHGKDGKDGIPGKDGSPGVDGIPGRNGQPGLRGEKGDQGILGPIGPTGLPGPRGRAGKPGTDGVPGSPGISAINCTVNGTQHILIPPGIVGRTPPYTMENITIEENKNIRIGCISTGNPAPTIIWRRLKEDSQTYVPKGQWGEINSHDEYIIFQNISRENMGKYMCIADNGIPPPSNATFLVNVHFPPFIKIDNVKMNITLGSDVRLECNIETFPHGVYYWENSRGDLYEQNYGRFKVDYIHIGLYETILQLNITSIRKEDLGIYYCIGKNDKGVTRGYINVTDDPISELPPVTDVCNKHRITFGTPPPPADGSLCPECTRCKICGFGYRDLEILIFQNNSKSILSRKFNCEMETIGKPVYHNSIPGVYGTWMRETSASDESYFVTLETRTNFLYTYDNKDNFIKSINKSTTLPKHFSGNDQVVHDGFFYYYTKEFNNATIIQYSIKQESGKPLTLDYCDTSNNNYLYKSEKNHVDIMADEEGVWVVCALIGSNNTAVTKINTTHLGIEYAWNISVKHQDAGDMFIICGVLYAVDSVTEFNTKISLALDLYRNKLLEDISITFTNPFKNTTMISYNQKHKELYTWDNGNMLTYPIKCNDLTNEKSNGNDTVNEIIGKSNDKQLNKT